MELKLIKEVLGEVLIRPDHRLDLELGEGILLAFPLLLSVLIQWLVDLELQLGQLNQSNKLAMDPTLLLGGHLVLGHLLLLVLLMVVKLKQAMLGPDEHFWCIQTLKTLRPARLLCTVPDRDRSPVTEVSR